MSWSEQRAMIVAAWSPLWRQRKKIFVYSIADTPRNQHSADIRHAGREITAATQESTIHRRVEHGKIAATYGAQRLINRTGLTSWTFTRWRDQHTSDKVAHYSIYRPRKDKRLSWPSWLTYSGRLTHKWSPVSYRSSVGQGKFAGQRPTFYHCATQPTNNKRQPSIHNDAFTHRLQGMSEN